MNGRSLSYSIQVCIHRGLSSSGNVSCLSVPNKKAWRFSRPFFASVSPALRPTIDLEERKVARGTEVNHVRNDERHVGVGHAQPARERRGVLVDRDAGHHVSLPDVYAGAEGGRSEGSVYFVAEDRPAEHEVMRAPAVIGPVAVRGEGASEIRGGEDRHVVLHAHLREPAVERVHRSVRDRQLLAVLGEKEVVVVEAAEADQKYLPARPEIAPRVDDAGDDVELRGEVARGVGQGECRCRRQTGAQQLVRRDRSIRDHAELVLEQVCARADDEAAVGGRCARGAVKGAGNPRDRHRAARAHLILDDVLARKEHGVAARRNAGELDVRVLAGKQVADSAAPTELRALPERRLRLPHGLLVVVREELGRQRHRTAVVLRNGRRHYERPDVGDDCELALVPAGLERGQRRMEGELASSLGRDRAGGGGGELVARDRDRVPRREVLVVGRLVVRNERIGLVVSAVEEETHEGSVTRGGLSRGGADRGEVECERTGHPGHGHERSGLEELASGRTHGLLPYFCTRYSGDDSVKNTASRTRLWRAVAWLVVGIAIELTASRAIVLVAALIVPAVRNRLTRSIRRSALSASASSAV